MASNPRTMTNLEAREKEQRSVCVFTEGFTEGRMATALLDRFFLTMAENVTKQSIW
jgi:hypothetical protein